MLSTVSKLRIIKIVKKIRAKYISFNEISVIVRFIWVKYSRIRQRF